MSSVDKIRLALELAGIELTNGESPGVQIRSCASMIAFASGGTQGPPRASRSEITRWERWSRLASFLPTVFG
jgi:hypothetical protein